jgi:hypothetical protein
MSPLLTLIILLLLLLALVQQFLFCYNFKKTPSPKGHFAHPEPKLEAFLRQFMKEWYLLIQGKEEGPYSILDLRHDNRITPDTLVWKQGFAHWMAIRDVPELNILFFDEESPEGEKEPLDAEKRAPLGGPSETTLAIRYEPPQFYLWLLFALVIIGYVFYQLSSLR